MNFTGQEFNEVNIADRKKKWGALPGFLVLDAGCNAPEGPAES
jgi:hypothetical protein